MLALGRKSPCRNGDAGTPRQLPQTRAFHLMVALSLSILGPTCLLQVHAYVTSGLPAHTHRAFLRRLTDDISAADPGTLTPGEVSSAPVLMSAWADAPEKLKLSSGGKGRERALAVEALLKRMIDERRAGNAEAVAKTEDYNAVMKSWAVSGEGSAAAMRVEQILMNMQGMYAAGDQDVQPNLESFQLAIEAWTRATDNPGALTRAQKILEWMATIYLSSANHLAAPHTSCFYPLLKGWASSGKLEAPIMSEHLIMWMQHLEMKHGIHSARPNSMCFNIVMSSWLKSKDITAESGSTDVKPDSSSYNIIISSIGPAIKKYHVMGGARRADRILARLEKGFLAGDESLRPDTIIYNQVIDFWAKTQSARGHFLKAREVLDRQIRMFKSGVRKCRPDVMSYTSVIAACASTYGSKLEKRSSFDLAHATFVESHKTHYTRPNDVTYGLMFKAASRLLSVKEEHNQYAKTLFGLCCDDGCLGEMAFNRMKDAVSEELLQEITNGKTYAELPDSWKCHVHRQERRQSPKITKK